MGESDGVGQGGLPGLLAVLADRGGGESTGGVVSIASQEAHYRDGQTRDSGSPDETGGRCGGVDPAAAAAEG